MNIHVQFSRPILYLLFTFLVIGCNEPADSPYPNISFEQKTVLPGTGRASAVAFVIDGKGYVALGRTAVSSGALNDCWMYTPVTDSWSARTAFPGKARVKAMAAVVDSKAYVGLGYDIDYGVYTGGNLKDFWMYDPTNDSWSQKSSYPSTATDACVSFVLGHSIYVGEGFNDHSFTNEFWKYDTDQDNWIRLTDFPGINRFGAVVCASNEHIFFGTGFDTYNDNDWWEYFPASDSWKQLKSMPDNGRLNAVSFSINNRYFVSTGRHFGGNHTVGHLFADVKEYDAVRNVWYDRGNIPLGERENAIAFVINGVGYIGQGENDTQMLNDFWSFKP